MSAGQKDILDSILGRLSNEDTVVSVRMNKHDDYEKNKMEIIALLPAK
jgi:hypothetical protein